MLKITSSIFPEKHSKNKLPSYPEMDVSYDEEKGYRIEVALAGYTKEEISVHRENYDLILEGELCVNCDNYSYLPNCKKIKLNHFKHTFKLPKDILDFQKINARFVDGLLIIEFPLRKDFTEENENIEIM
jgi:HSP20 family molecular chaperone IbpA